jgi:hypothetical protein
VADEDIVPEAQDEWLVKAEGLELLDQDYRKENGEYVWRYQFTAYETGPVSIPPIAVTLGPQSFSSERLELNVLSDRAPEDEQLRPDAGPLRPPIDWLFWTGLLLLAGLALAARWYLRKHPLKTKRPRPVAPPAPVENPKDWLRKQLLVLRARIDAHPGDSHMPDAWASILREFARRKMSLPIPAWTTREMRARLSTEDFARLCELMQDCDRFKFMKDRDGKAATPDKATLKWIEESERLFL